MDTNSVISLVNIVTPEKTQVHTDLGLTSDEYGVDFAETLEQAHSKTNQTAIQDESSNTSVQPEYQEPISDVRKESEEKVSIALKTPSDKNEIQKQAVKNSSQVTPNQQPENETKTTQNPKNQKIKEILQHIDIQIPLESSSIVSKHALITTQSVVEGIKTSQKPQINSDNSNKRHQTTSTKQNIIINVTAPSKKTAVITPKMATIVERDSSTALSVENSDFAAVSKNSITINSLEQNQGRLTFVDDVSMRGNLVDKIQHTPQKVQSEAEAPQVFSKTLEAPQAFTKTLLVKEENELVASQSSKALISHEVDANPKQNQQNIITNSTKQPLPRQQAQMAQEIQSPRSSPPPSIHEDLAPRYSNEQKTSEILPDFQLQAKAVQANKTTANSLVGKTTGEELQIKSIQTSSSTVQNIDINVETATQPQINTEGGQNQSFEPADLSQQNQNADAGVLLNAASASVGRQIQESIQSSLAGKQQQITVNLQPPELGRITIKFEQQGDDITGQLEVTKAETRSVITEQLPEVIKNLVEAGIQLKKVEVSMSNQDSQEGYKDQQPQDMFLSDQDNLGRQYESHQQSDDYDTSNGSIEQEQTFEDNFYDRQMNPGQEGSLNMLV